jgi:hypothetical protein
MTDHPEPELPELHYELMVLGYELMALLSHAESREAILQSPKTLEQMRALHATLEEIASQWRQVPE